MTRAEYNKLILQALTKVLTDSPDLRFGQACINLNLFPSLTDAEAANLFYTESSKSYEYLRKWTVP
jgi:hypothetical protein